MAPAGPFLAATAVARRRALLACASLVLGCAGPAGEGATERANELAIRSLVASWESADTALIEELFWPQATYDDYPNQITHQGIEEIVGYVTAVHDWADDVYMNVGRVHVGPSSAVAEWVFSAVQSRPMGDAVPTGTGREVVLNGVTIIELERGRIIRAADYTDTGLMMLQLGGRIEMPGGQVLELDVGRD